MTGSVATVGPAHTLRQAAAKMAIHRAGAAVVLDPDAEGYDGSTDAVGDSMIESSTSMASSGGG
jgi:CBS domain-containing protein